MTNENGSTMSPVDDFSCFLGGRVDDIVICWWMTD